MPDYAEELLGFVFDLEQVGRDAETKARRWPCFGGRDADLDRELEGMWPLAELADLIQDLLDRCIDTLKAAAAESAFPITLVCPSKLR